MRAKLLFLAVLACHLGSAQAGSGQTRGIGDVVLVESKATKIDAHRAALARLHAEIPGLTTAWQNRLRTLRNEAADLQREMDGHLHDLRNGNYCSECGRSRTQLQNQGENFEAHLRRVGGRSIPASAERLEQVRREYMQRIASKLAQVQKEEEGDPQIASRRRDIVVMESEIPQLCSEITEHGRAYGGKVLAEAQTDHKGFAEALMAHISAILIAEDKIVIYEARKANQDREFARAAQAARQEVEQANLRKQEELKGQIVSLQAGLERLRVDSEQRARDWRARMEELRTELTRIELELARRDLTDGDREALTTMQTRLEQELAALQQNRVELQNRFDAESTRVTVESQGLQSEIWQVGSNLSGEQDEAVARLQASFDQRKAATDALIAAATATVQNETAAFHAKAELFRGRVLRYQDLVAQESDRMMAAGGRVGCAVPNDARFEVLGNWNKIYPCVSSHLMSKPRTENIFGSYCTGDASTLAYLSSYRQFLGGLSPEELQTVQNSSNPNWFDTVTRP